MSEALDNEAESVVIGGMVLDINATPSIAANPRTTTPGKVYYALGGVARNIAECMSKLGARPYMLSALGFDLAGNMLLEDWGSAGLSLEGIKRSKDIETAVVCNVFDRRGEVAAGVASVESIEKFLTPEWIRKFKTKIHSAPLLMVDANLSPPSLVSSCQMAAESETSIWFEPVSVLKSKRISSIVKHITYTSPNEDELVAMANVVSSEDKFLPIQRDGSGFNSSIESLFHILKPPIWVLLEKGIRVVIVTLGPHGIFLCFKAINGIKKCAPMSQGNYYMAIHFPALPASVVRVTGAGDCLVGGTIASICAGLDIMQSVAVGIAAAKGAVEAESNVPAQYELTRIADDAGTVYSQAKVVYCESKL